MTKNQFTGPTSIPAEVLDKIKAHRPHLGAIVANCQRQDVGRRFDKPLADAYLIGETHLTGLETFHLSACCAGRKYGESVSGEMLYQAGTNPSQVRDDIGAIFGRLDDGGNVRLLYETDGSPVTRLLVDGVYPVGSLLSTHYEHPEGITITRADADKLGIEIEGNWT